jgi:NAD(P)-dependent dehydrogenase (short-subunit alcohol dehydrogenase family)
VDASQLMFRSDVMKGERILVTGGGSGLGRGMAEAFLRCGAEVIICGRRGAVVEAAAHAMREACGGTIVSYACDIRSPDAIGAMLDQIWAEGPLTGLVNNAAGNFLSRTEDLSMGGFDAIANIVFRGTFAMTLDIGKRWIEEGRGGNILSILTTWVWNGGPFTVPSAMSKAGLNVMTQSLAVEWARYGIRANAICPGTFPTEGMTERLYPAGTDAPADVTPKFNPMARVGEMHELCNLAILLMAPGASFINGETIAIDGGSYLSGGREQRLASWTDEQWVSAREAIRAANDADKRKRTAVP